MEEFITSFQEFREWLYSLPAVSPDEAKLLDKIKSKFEELELDKAF